MRTNRPSTGALLLAAVHFISGTIARPSSSSPSLSALTLSLSSLLATRSNVVAAANAPAGGAGTSNSSSGACGWSSSCPKSSPCCSEFGYCGSGGSCLAGCNPQGSYGEGYCAPVPICQSSNFTFTDTSRIQMNHSAWNGDPSKYDFTLEVEDTSNTPIIQNGNLQLVLSEKGGGTKVSTTRTVLYGTIQAAVRSVAQDGVVTAFITMSGVKDEIDLEWTTSNASETQTNYYWEGDVNNYENGGTAITRNRDTTFHIFGINWTPDRLDWTIDGRTVRTLLKSDTTNGRFPQTPSRVQFSVWPAGISSSPQGTIDWAGGLIDWSQTGSQGYFSSEVQWLSIDCYDNSALPFVTSNQSTSTNSSSSKRSLAVDDGLWERSLWERAPVVNSYVYGTNDSNGQIGVAGSNAGTIINSPYSTGQNMLVKNGDTKGVTGTKTGTSGGLFGNSAVGNWWDKLATAAKAGIIIGICAGVLFILVALCTCFARRRDQRKAALRKQQIQNDAIPLVSKTGAPSGGGASPQRGNGSRSQVNLPTKYARSNSDFDASSVVSKGSYYRAQSPLPEVPSIPNHYAQNQQLGYQYPSPQAYGGGGYQSPQYYYGGGGAPPYQPQQQWPQQGGGRY
ncbi:uncharacterized protein JCM6883_002095 [Sporobolomyces salmoneus]|uniref:uncharacterized protein n=1 Tax=Sporobolomyces salmoneus TaxID=183962 RepID=UPI003174D63A